MMTLAVEPLLKLELCSLAIVTLMMKVNVLYSIIQLSILFERSESALDGR